jgi:hypothetical protein
MVEGEFTRKGRPAIAQSRMEVACREGEAGRPAALIARGTEKMADVTENSQGH